MNDSENRGIFIRHSDVFGTPPKINEILNELSQFSLPNIYPIFAQISCVLFADGPPTHQTQQKLVTDFFNESDVNALNIAIKNIPQKTSKIIFHVQACLWLMKYSTQVCKKNYGRKINDKSLRSIGSLFLKANDFLSFDKRQQAQLNSEDAETRRDWLITEFMPIIELLNPPSPHFSLARSDIWFNELIPSLDLPLDIEKMIPEALGMTLDEYQSLMIVTLSPYLSPASKILENLNSLLINAKTFTKQTQFPIAVWKRFLDENVCPLANLPDKIYYTQPYPPQYDFLFFRQFPFIELEKKLLLCSYPGFLIEKVFDGIYHLLLQKANSTKQTQDLQSAWGTIFEEYVNRVLMEFTPSNFTKAPNFNDGTEVSDGILSYGNDLVVIEYKASRISLESKYGGDPQRLDSELRAKFGISKSGKTKGIGQLGKSIGSLFGIGAFKKKDCSSISTEGVRRVFPILVTLDKSMGAPFLNWKLNDEFQTLLKKWHIADETVNVMPLTIMTIEDVETIAPYLTLGLQLNVCIDMKYRNDPLQKVTFQDFMHENYYQRGLRNEFLEEKFRSFSNRMMKLFYPEIKGLHKNIALL